MPIPIGSEGPTPDTISVISSDDLVDIPGVSGSEVELAYAARRASTAVMKAWCNQTTPVPQWVKDIAIDVAGRHLANPRGRSSITYSKSLDDASKSETERFEGSSSRGGFSLTDAELAQLCPPSAGKTPRGVGSIRLRVPGYQP